MISPKQKALFYALVALKNLQGLPTIDSVSGCTARDVINYVLLFRTKRTGKTTSRRKLASCMRRALRDGVKLGVFFERDGRFQTAFCLQHQVETSAIGGDPLYHIENWLTHGSGQEYVSALFGQPQPDPSELFGDYSALIYPHAGLKDRPRTLGNPGAMANHEAMDNHGAIDSPGVVRDPGAMTNARAMDNHGVMDNPGAMGNHEAVDNCLESRLDEYTGLFVVDHRTKVNIPSEKSCSFPENDHMPSRLRAGNPEEEVAGPSGLLAEYPGGEGDDCAGSSGLLVPEAPREEVHSVETGSSSCEETCRYLLGRDTRATSERERSGGYVEQWLESNNNIMPMAVDGEDSEPDEPVRRVTRGKRRLECDDSPGPSRKRAREDVDSSSLESNRLKVSGDRVVGKRPVGAEKEKCEDTTYSKRLKRYDLRLSRDRTGLCDSMIDNYVPCGVEPDSWLTNRKKLFALKCLKLQVSYMSPRTRTVQELLKALDKKIKISQAVIFLLDKLSDQ